MKKLRIIILLFFIAVTAVFVTSRVREHMTSDQSAPVITADSDSITVSVKATEEELLAGMRAQDNLDGDVTDTLVVVSKSKFISRGVIRMNYAAFDENNNVGTYSREVHFSDYVPPRYSISRPLRFQAGNSNNDYLQYVTAEDCIDGNITQKIRITFGETTAVNTTASVQEASLMVTNSVGDNAVLPLQIRTEEYATFNQRAPALENYILYVSRGARPDLRENICGVWTASRTLTFAEAKVNADTDITVDDSGVDYMTPGIYKAYYQLSQTASNGTRTDLGTAELIVVVEE